MRETILPREMKDLETAFMKESGVPGALLMEHAAFAVCSALSSYCRKDDWVLFACGPGNNGGDGYAAARLWQFRGGHSVICELTDQGKGDARMNRELALAMGIRIIPADSVRDFLPFCHAVVDALFGTGLSRAPEGAAAEKIRLINESELPVIGVDIPSGLNGTDGQILGCAVSCTETVTFHRIKEGLLTGSGPACTGKLTVAPILIPENYGDIPGMKVFEERDLPAAVAARPVMANKGTLGRVVILAGSCGMCGAAAYAAKACMTAGAGLTTVLTRKELIPVIQDLCPGATCRALPADPDAMRSMIRDCTASVSAVVVGCGLGQDPSVLPALQELGHSPVPVIWDADALNLLAANQSLLPLPANHVMTPHPGEAARLLGCSVSDVIKNPLDALKRLYDKAHCLVLLKGARSLMTDGQRIAINPNGSPALAKGGSGDILSGILGALMARPGSADGLLRLQAGAWIHGKAGEKAALSKGVDSVLPDDVIACIRLG